MAHLLSPSPAMGTRWLHLHIGAPGLQGAFPKNYQGDHILASQNKIWTMEILSTIGKTSGAGMATLLNLHNGCGGSLGRNFSQDLVNASRPPLEND